MKVRNNKSFVQYASRMNYDIYRSRTHENLFIAVDLDDNVILELNSNRDVVTHPSGGFRSEKEANIFHNVVLDFLEIIN